LGGSVDPPALLNDAPVRHREKGGKGNEKGANEKDEKRGKASELGGNGLLALRGDGRPWLECIVISEASVQPH